MTRIPILVSCAAVAALLLWPSARAAAANNAANGNAAQTIAPTGPAQWSMFKNRKTRTGRTSSVGPQTNALKWERDLHRGIGIQSPQAIGNDGTIYSGSYLGFLYAFAPDGTVKWKYRLAKRQINAGPAIGNDGTIYLAAEDGRLHAFAPDGTVKWIFDLAGYSGPSSSPAVGEDGVIYAGSTKFYAINPDGTQKWSYDTGGWINGPPAIGGDGTIYFPSVNTLFAFHPDGTLKWKSPGHATYPIGSAPAIGADGTIYVNTHNGVLHAFRHNGAFAWSYSTQGIVMDVPSSPAIGSDGTIYFGGAGEYPGRGGGYFYAVNPDGSFKWKYFAGCDQTAPSIGGDGTIYFGTDNCHTIHAVNSDGTRKWCYGKTGGAFMRSPQAIGRDGLMYTAFLVDPTLLPYGGLLAFADSGDSAAMPGTGPRPALPSGCE